VAVVEKSDLGVDVVYGIDDKSRFLTITGPWPELRRSVCRTKEFIPTVELCPGHNLLQSALEAIDFGYTNIGESRDCMSIQRAQGDLVEIYQSKSSNAGASKRSRSMRSDTTAADHDDKSLADFGEAIICEKDAISGKLFEDEC
jgi:hypothetical protein